MVNLSAVGRWRLVILIVAMSVMVIVATGVAVWELYQTAFSQHAIQLQQSVKSQKELIAAVGRFDAEHSQEDHIGGSIGGTLSQVVDAHRQYEISSGTEAFVLAEKIGADYAIILLHSSEQVLVTDLHGLGGEPVTSPPWMEQLSLFDGGDLAGVVQTERILAAYDTIDIAGHQFIFLSKVDLNEIRAPFISAIEISGAVALLLVFAGSLVVLLLVNPLFARLNHQRDNLEELVAKATAEMNVIIQTAVDGIVAIDETGTIHLFNPAAERLFGWKAGEVLGKNVSLLMSEQNAADHNGMIHKYVQTGESRIIGRGREVAALRKDGSTFPAYVAVGHAELANGSHHFVAFVADITTYKRAQEKILEAKEAAEGVAQTKANFLANMSHEIRTPMNAVIGFAEVVLQDPKLSESTRLHIQTIYNSGKNLLRIINDILDFSKVEAGRIELEEVPFHMPNAIQDALRTVESQAQAKGLEIKLHLDQQPAQRRIGDPTRLRQVILNLVSNAIKFTEQGGITVAISTADAPELVHFSVTDTGIGMSVDEVAKVFESFSQADASTTRRYGGTGLGTTISKQLVELMGGRIWVESEPGVGSTFHFTVRLREADAGEECLYEEDTKPVAEYLSPRGFRILLAEDVPTNAALAQLRLEHQGHTVTWVHNGREAVNAFLEGGHDLILMDVQMPEIDGIEATREIRRIESEKDIHGRLPIIALTASVMKEDLKQCIDAGMDAVVCKPIDFLELLNTIEKVVPEGVGKFNDGITIKIARQAVIDFNPLQEVAAPDTGLESWQEPLIYAKALVNFAAEHAKDAVIMGQLLDESPADNEPARAVAHALKGVAGNLALTSVTTLATDIDASLKSGDREGALALIPPLDSALEKTCHAIGNLKFPGQVAEIAKKVFDEKEVFAIFEALLERLEHLNPDVVEPVLTELSGYLPETDLAEIRRQVEGFNFDGAKSATKALIDRLEIGQGEPVT